MSSKKCPKCHYQRRFEHFVVSHPSGVGRYTEVSKYCIWCRLNIDECDICHESYDKHFMKTKKNVHYCIFCGKDGMNNVLKTLYKNAVCNALK
jgi:hypothetical protein